MPELKDLILRQNSQFIDDGVAVVWPAVANFVGPSINEPHCTVAYFGTVDEVFAMGGDMEQFVRVFQAATQETYVAPNMWKPNAVVGYELFGKDENVPVATINLDKLHSRFRRTLIGRFANEDIPIAPRNDFGKYRPHITLSEHEQGKTYFRKVRAKKSRMGLVFLGSPQLWWGDFRVGVKASWFN